MEPETKLLDRRFYHLGRMTAVLGLEARAHGDIRWVHFYYALGFIPWASLQEPLQKHQQREALS